MNKNINIPGRLHSVATDGQVAGANEIYDDTLGKFQQEVNTELHEEMEDAKEVVDSFDDRVKAIEDLAEISIEGGEVQVANTVEEIVAGSGKVPTANAVAPLKEDILQGAVYDVSAKNPTAGPNNDGKWESLSALLSDANLNTLIPTAVRKGGMSIKFVQSSDNKYVQYRLMSDSFNTTPANWQGVDDEPTAGSDNMVKSGGVAEKIQDVDFRLNVYNNDINTNIFEVGNINCIANPITFIRTGSSPWQSAVVAVKAGEKYNVKSYSSSTSAYGIAVFNKNRELLSHQDTSNTFVEVTIEQDGFLVVNHGYNSTPELSRVKVYSLAEKRNILKDWILSESYYLRGAASYTDGVINSPITIYYPDESYGEITLTRNSDGLVTALSATNVQFGLQLNMTILRYADGTARAQSISFQGL